MMKKLMTAAAFGMALLAVTNVSSAAGRDQHWAIERTQQAKQKLQEAKTADVMDRRVLMLAHMDMVGEVLDELMIMMPDAGLNMQQTAQWVVDHQRITKEVLRQMVEEHRLMMKELSSR